MTKTPHSGANPALKLGTRASPLALAQARLVTQALAFAGVAETAVHPVETLGDKVQDRPLAEIGGKALWTRELDRALLHRQVDFAVHSMKDVETALPPGIALAAVLPRADSRDRLVGAGSVSDIPAGARVGTSSPRRAAQLLHRRPDVETVSLRGNVGTRLRHIAEGRIAASFLAAAGLERLHIDAGVPLEMDDWLPAAAQGIIGITCRADDAATLDLLRRIDHAATMRVLQAERAVLEGLGGSCQTAVAVHAAAQGNGLLLKAELLSPDGRDRVTGSIEGSGEPRQLGLALAAQLMAAATSAILASLEEVRRP